MRCDPRRHGGQNRSRLTAQKERIKKVLLFFAVDVTSYLGTVKCRAAGLSGRRCRLLWWLLGGLLPALLIILFCSHSDASFHENCTFKAILNTENTTKSIPIVIVSPDISITYPSVFVLRSLFSAVSLAYISRRL